MNQSQTTKVGWEKKTGHPQSRRLAQCTIPLELLRPYMYKAHRSAHVLRHEKECEKNALTGCRDMEQTRTVLGLGLEQRVPFL